MTKLLSFILSLIALFIALHYYFSFRLFHHIFAPFNINMLGILSLDDIMFSFAYINTLSIGFCIFICIIIFIILLMFSGLIKTIELFLKAHKREIPVVGFVILCILFLAVDSYYKKKLNEKKTTTAVSRTTIVLSNNKIIKSNSYRKLIWLGSKYAFFFNEKTQHIELYPVGSILEFHYLYSSPPKESKKNNK